MNGLHVLRRNWQSSKRRDSENPQNIRDYTTMSQLISLSNMENMNLIAIPSSQKNRRRMKIPRRMLITTTNR